MFKEVFCFIVIFTVIFGVTGCKNPIVNDSTGGLPPSTNSDLYRVTAPFTAQTYNQNSGNQTFQMEIEQGDGLSDPDDDVVYFKSSLLPDWIVLDEETGVVTVDTTAVHCRISVYFWSEGIDGRDTSETPFEVIVRVCSQPPYPVTAGFSAQSFHQGAAGCSFQMSIDEVGGLKDPDDDTVYFRSNVPAWLTLDQNTGLVTVDTDCECAALSISFWTEDQYGEDTSGTSYDVVVDVFNNAPYAVTEPSFMNFVSGNPSPQTDQLVTNAPGGTPAGFLDPDDDATIFVSDSLPVYVELDALSGVITVTDAPVGNSQIKVWLVDANLKKSADFTVTLNFAP